MEIVKISLCIPTKDRFDNFLNNNLSKYINYLNDGLIDEIIICDENGNDYNNIVDKYINNEKSTVKITNIDNFRIYKNDKVLGVFLNKIKVCNLAKNNFIALIDSDNFANDIYFKVVKDYIVSKNIITNRILAPCFAKPRFDSVMRDYKNYIFTKYNCKYLVHNNNFNILINTGNYVITKNIVENIKYDETILHKISACDVMYFNLLAFQQFDNLEFHVIEGLEYDHVVHENCVSLETYRECDETKYGFVLPSFERF